MGTAVAERQRPKRIWSGTWICRQEWEQGPVKLLCISLFCKGSFYFSSHKVLVVFGSISGKSSDRDELFLNQISKGFGTSVLSHNMKCGFLFSIFIWIDINECLKKITISAFSVVIYLCLLNAYADCRYCAGKSYLVSASLFGLGGGKGKTRLWCNCDKTFADQL